MRTGMVTTAGCTLGAAIGGGWTAVIIGGYYSDLAWAVWGLALDYIAEAATEAAVVFLIGAGLGALLGTFTVYGVVSPLVALWTKRKRGLDGAE